MIRVLLLLAALAVFNVAQARADDNAFGRALYHGVEPFSAGATRLPAAFAACARCHGLNGEGGQEGTLSAPPVTWSALTGPRAGANGFADEAAVLRAITAGEGRNGLRLNAGMPRYDLGFADAAALVSFLHRLGTSDDQPRGVDKQTIALGTLLPLSGPAGGIGRAVLVGLRDSFDAVNRSGGVFGRRVDLHAQDTAGGAGAAAEQLLAKPVFAVVGGLWPVRSAVDGFLARHSVSAIAPLVPAEDIQTQDWTLELLSTRAEQQAALAKALGQCPVSGERWGLRLRPEAAAERDSPIRWFEDVGTLRSALATAPAVGCLGVELAAVPQVRNAIPRGWHSRVVLPVPAALLRPEGADRTPWRRLGRVAGELAVELLSRSGPQLQEHSPLEAAARLGDFAPLRLASLRSESGRFLGWGADVIDLDSAEPSGAAEPMAQGG